MQRIGRTRYRGFGKTHLQHVITAVAISLLLIAFWAAEYPWSGLDLPGLHPYTYGPNEFVISVNNVASPPEEHIATYHRAYLCTHNKKY